MLKTALRSSPKFKRGKEFKQQHYAFHELEAETLTELNAAVVFLLDGETHPVAITKAAIRTKVNAFFI